MAVSVGLVPWSPYPGHRSLTRRGEDNGGIQRPEGRCRYGAPRSPHLPARLRTRVPEADFGGAAGPDHRRAGGTRPRSQTGRRPEQPRVLGRQRRSCRSDDRSRRPSGARSAPSRRARLRRRNHGPGTRYRPPPWPPTFCPFRGPVRPRHGRCRQEVAPITDQDGGHLEPTSSEVSSLGQVLRFAAEHGDRGLVLKPANRQASVGVQILDARAAANAAGSSGPDRASVCHRHRPSARPRHPGRLLGRVPADRKGGELRGAGGRRADPVDQSNGQAGDLRFPSRRATPRRPCRVVPPGWHRPCIGHAAARRGGRLRHRCTTRRVDPHWRRAVPRGVRRSAARRPHRRAHRPAGVDLCAVYTKLLTGVTVDVPSAPRRGAAIVFLGPEQGMGCLEDVEGWRRRVHCLGSWTST